MLLGPGAGGKPISGTSVMPRPAVGFTIWTPDVPRPIPPNYTIAGGPAAASVGHV